jgi:DNA polymerase I-like protein with 3'-5' exonuclease and polymerase domains
MKTAMQELIEEVRRLRKNGFSVDDKYLQGLLEKEKEQMFDFFLKGYSIGESDFNPKSEANKYYNQTYKEEIEKL